MPGLGTVMVPIYALTVRICEYAEAFTDTHGSVGPARLVATRTLLGAGAADLADQTNRLPRGVAGPPSCAVPATIPPDAQVYSLTFSDGTQVVEVERRIAPCVPDQASNGTFLADVTPRWSKRLERVTIPVPTTPTTAAAG